MKSRGVGWLRFVPLSTLCWPITLKRHLQPRLLSGQWSMSLRPTEVSHRKQVKAKNNTKKKRLSASIYEVVINIVKTCNNDNHPPLHAWTYKHNLIYFSIIYDWLRFAWEWEFMQKQWLHCDFTVWNSKVPSPPPHPVPLVLIESLSYNVPLT